MTKIRDSNILITGGASGLGKSLGRLALAKGASRLIIWDVNRDSVKQTIETLRYKHPAVSGHVVDLGNPLPIRHQAEQVLEKYQSIDILVNNAATIYKGYFADQDQNDVSRTLRINVEGSMHCVRRFLPSMLSRGKGHIVNIASASAIVPLPGMAVYAASKSALSAWGDCLRMELKGCCPGIRVTNVFPGHLSTDMFAGHESCVYIPTLDPDKVSRIIISAVEKNRRSVSMPLLVRLAPVLKAILPGPLFDFGLSLMNLDRKFLPCEAKSKYPPKKRCKIKVF